MRKEGFPTSNKLYLYVLNVPIGLMVTAIYFSAYTEITFIDLEIDLVITELHTGIMEKGKTQALFSLHLK